MRNDFSERVMYPNGDRTEHDGSISAYGRNGFIRCAGLAISRCCDIVHLRPVTSRNDVSTSCRIDVPACSVLLTELIDQLVALRHELEMEGE